MKNNIAYKIYRLSTIKKIENKIKLLGIYNNYKTTTFLNTRLILTIIIFIISLLIFKNGYILAPILAFIFYISMEIIVLDIPIKKRAKKLEEEALFFFEILLISIESGRSLKHAIELTSANINSELSEEFKKTIAEESLGKSLKESLRDMKYRIPSDTINNAILNIIESDIFGSDIVYSMNNQIEYLREKRLLDKKAEIGKLPTKISIISVIFFIPIMLLLILGPVIINYIYK